MNEVQPLKKETVSRMKIASFGLGGIISQLIIAAYTILIFYYYEVELGLSSILVGLSFVIYAIWNMINDPLIGYLTDKPFKWSKKLGLRTPWVIFGGFFLIISFYFLFAVPDFGDVKSNPWPLFSYMVIITCLVDTFYTVYTNHYFGGIGNIFRTKDERRKGSTIIMLCSTFGSLLGQGIIVPAVVRYGDRTSYVRFGLIASIILGIFLIFLIPGVYENEVVKKRYLQIFEFLDTKKMPYWQFLKITFKQKNFMAVTLAITLFTLAQTLNAASMLYMLHDVLNATVQDMQIVFVVFFLSFLISLPIWSMWLSKKIDHIYLLMIGIFCFGVMHTNALYANTVIDLLPSVVWGGVGNAAMATAMWSIVADTMDEVNVACGRHVEAGLVGIRNFFFRAAYVFVGLVIAGVHIATGYVPGASEQTELAKLGVRIHTGLFPVFFDTIAAIILWKYYDLRGDKRVQLMAQRKKLGL